MILNIFGSSGSGSTTLAKKIAREHQFNLIDVDDYLWKKTRIPFSERYTNQEAKELIQEAISEHEHHVISGSLVGICDDLKPQIDLFLYINLDINLRLKRIHEREVTRFGSRVLEGGDLYSQHQEFLKWVSEYDSNSEEERSRRQHLLWLDDVTVPVFKVTEELTMDELLKLVNPFIEKNKEE